MDNNKVSSKKNVGGVVLDILTIGMLFASFAALFYSGFIIQSDSFPLGAMCIITVVGLLLLFFIGSVSCLSSKVKNQSLTLGFLVFSAVQVVALVVNFALLLGLMIKLFNVETLSVRLTYVLTVSLVLIGYVASISYFSDGVVDANSEEEEESEEEADDEDQSDEEEESEEEADDEDQSDEEEESEEEADDEDESDEEEEFEEEADDEDQSDEEEESEEESVEEVDGEKEKTDTEIVDEV